MNYQFKLGFASLLHIEWIRNIETSIGIGQEKESLMRSFRRTSFLDGQRDLQSIGTAERDGLGQWLVLRDPA